jgi:hypothetical protein
MSGKGPLAPKLSRFIPLSDEDVRVLDALCVNEEQARARRQSAKAERVRE